MAWFTRHLAAPSLVVALLAGILFANQQHLTPADVGDYHQRVSDAVDAVPYAIGDWVGKDVPVPTQATDMLQPNALLSRLYVNTLTNQRINVLLVHTRDARDLVGHYPPECYPANGWTLAGRRDISLPAGPGDPVTVAQYDFTMSHFTGTDRLEVLNLMVLPTGRFSLGMGGVSGVSGDYRIRPFGAAELQIVFNSPPAPEARDAVWQAFFPALEPALETIRSGVADEADKTPAP